MRRSLLVILIVAVISSWIARAERTAGVAHAKVAAASPDDWVRTSAGWQRRASLTASPHVPPVNIHPGLVAGFQVTASLLALLLFPGRAVAVRAPAPAVTRRSRIRPVAEVAASR